MLTWSSLRCPKYYGRLQGFFRGRGIDPIENPQKPKRTQVTLKNPKHTCSKSKGQAYVPKNNCRHSNYFHADSPAIV